MIRQDKIKKVEDIKGIFEQKKSIIFTDHSGLKAENTYSMRTRLSEIDSTLRIIKNTLAVRAAKEAYEDIDLEEIFKGPTSMIVCGQDMVSAAKLAKIFGKEFETFKIKAGIMEGKLYDGASVEKLATLPSREVLLAQLLGLMLNPLISFVSVLSVVPRNLALVLDSVRKQKEEAQG
ncbi:MAG: 50S ribosomal protein L10 [Actinobacteria bacterium]|nr:50S ribosomal protein L10 [Actinomycetota bacterium]